MPINELVRFCNSQYISKAQQCPDCPNKEQGKCSSSNCSTCFQDMFFGAGRRFNCICSTYSYVCRYIYQYSSEILHLLRVFKKFFVDEQNNFKLEDIDILSIGSGPCSEAFAFDLFLKEISYKGNITFNGYEINNIWETVHSRVKQVLPFDVNLYYADCFTSIGSTEDFQYPNVLIMNYLLSDICKHGDIEDFLKNVVDLIINKMPPKSMIIVNDINLWKPRDYYKTLIDKVNENNNSGHASFSFIGYSYGIRYPYNHTIFSLTEKSINYLTSKYGTKIYCTSSQLVILKKSNK